MIILWINKLDNNPLWTPPPPLSPYAALCQTPIIIYYVLTLSENARNLHFVDMLLL